MKGPLRLLYVTYHENIVSSGILHTQVVKMLQALRAAAPEANVTLLSILSLPIWLKRRRALKSLRRTLQAKGIRLVTFPSLVPPRWGWTAAAAMLPWALVVRWTMLMRRCNIIHARGYGAAWLAWLGAIWFRSPLLFDPRGPFPDEEVLNGHWREGGLSQRLWKRIESLLLRRCAGVIGVTPFYRDLFRRQGARRAWFVPNRVDTERFRSLQHRDAPAAARGAPTLLFTGELASRWNDPDIILSHFTAVLSRHPKASLRLVTHSGGELVRLRAQKLGIPDERVELVSAEPENLCDAMRGATVGLVFRSPNKPSVWPVKMAEYLAAGVPVMADVGFSGLAGEILVKAGVGFFADPKNPDTYAPIERILESREAWSQRCRLFARRRLDLGATARQHLRIYRQFAALSGR